MNIEVCKKIKQPQGFDASIPNTFPVKGLFDISQKLINKAGEAERLVGKLDGITQILPDIQFFLKMFSLKDATSSAQIEGTKATMVDAVEMDAGIEGKDSDAQDIIFYIKALKYGIERIKEFPLSLRFIRELHSELMKGARATHFSDPGEFRNSQNWIGGTSPSNAAFVPPPIHEMKKSLSDLEKFMYDEKATLPIIHIAFLHAQFETIHPFLDGNGRAGRLLITLALYKLNLLENPVLFLSSYFKQHQKTYYSKLNSYHSGEVFEWLEFFLDGVIDTANKSIAMAKKIKDIYKEDMLKIQALAKRESESGVLVLSKLYGNPIITPKTIMDWTGFTRSGAQKVIDRLMKIGILEIRDEEKTYDKKYSYKKYLSVFID
ncbi:MAG: Fic family protein [Bacteroidales bacterium]|jgi:Fic family protein|nr:Fic family protein [Bacteroidales bacterium]